MIRYLIVDDEYVAHDIIKGYCDLLPNLQLMKNCYDALEALEYLNHHEVDLIFLDLNMPKLKGFEFLKTLPAPPTVIVTTAYQEYALEGYELNVADYLLKPFSFERFLKAVNKAINKERKPAANPRNKPKETEKTVFLKSNKKYIQVRLDSIYYIEAAGNYVKVFTADDTITIRAKISDILSSLQSENFLQVHKSFAVAIKHIKSVEGNRISVGNQMVPIGKMYKLKVNQLLS